MGQTIGRILLSDPTGQIERECAEPKLLQKDVALTYPLALCGEDVVPVDWKRANEAILKRWPKGLIRVKEAAWQMINTGKIPSVEDR